MRIWAYPGYGCERENRPAKARRLNHLVPLLFGTFLRVWAGGRRIADTATPGDPARS